MTQSATTVTAAVHAWGVPVRVSIHNRWNTPSALAARPAVSPRQTRPSRFRIASVNALDFSLTRTLAPHVLPPSGDAANRTSQPGSAPAASRVSYHDTPTTPSLLTATAGMDAPR